MPLSVGVKVYQAGAVDDLNEPVDAWAAPIATPVYGWAPAGTGEPFLAGREAVTWDLDLYVPPGFSVAAKDRVEVGGVEYKVEGVVEQFNSGPFGFAPGGRVRLKRAEG